MSSIQNKSDSANWPYVRTFRRKKRLAFWSTTIAIFFLLSIAATFQIRQYTTTAQIELSASGTQPQQFLQTIIDGELTDRSLQQHLARVKNSLHEPDLQFDLDQLRKALTFGVAQRTSGKQFRVDVTVTGNGSDVEQYFAESIVQRLAERLTTADAIETALVAVDKQYQRIQSTVTATAANINRDLIGTNEQVEELNRGLSDIHREVELLKPQRNLNGNFNDTNIAYEKDRAQISSLLTDLQNQLKRIETANDDREFHQIGQSIAKINQQLQHLDLPVLGEQQKSLRIINASLPEQSSTATNILEMLRNLDTDAIQTRIGQIQNHLEADARQINQQVDQLITLAQRLSESQFVVNAVSPIHTRPTQSAPRVPLMLMFGMLAFAGGSLASRYYRPDLDDIGFTNVDQASEILGVPVIADLRTEPGTEPPQRPVAPVANTIVHASEMLLFCSVLLVVAICFIQPDIRQSFFENPFYGAVRIAALFTHN